MTNQKEYEDRILNPIPALILVLLVAVAAGIYLLRSPNTQDEPELAPVVTSEPVATAIAEDKPEITLLSVDEVESVLKPAADLITSRYYYTNAADFDSVLTWFHTTVENPFTHSKGYIMYDGVVSIGIDMSSVKYEVDNKTKTITVTLPPEKILAHEIDNNSVVSDAKESIFNTLDAEYYSKLIGGLKEGTETKIMNNTEYINSVRANTETVFRSLLASSELTNDYNVQFR